MGTRHLTAVILGGEFRVAQYGQWDGYPAGQGETIIKFLKKWDREDFEKKLSASSFLTDEEIKAINAKIEAGGIKDNWQKIWPELTRDTGAGILQLIADSEAGLKLKDTRSFAADSIFCEYAYVLDLDKNMLELYKGFNKEPLKEGDRFFGVTEADTNKEYYPVRKVGEWPLSKLPTIKQMEKVTEKEEVEAE